MSNAAKERVVDYPCVHSRYLVCGHVPGTEAGDAESTDCPGACRTAGGDGESHLRRGLFLVYRSVVSAVEGSRVRGVRLLRRQREDPTYEEVCTGTSGHAESVQVTFDPKKISYEELLEVFWQMHDPTTPNRQGNDVGPQYRSAIFWHTEEQKRSAEHYKQRLEAAGVFASPIVTEIVPFTEFYRAEAYHQNYFVEHSGGRYCQLVIRPELDKMKKVFKEKLK